MLGSTGTGKTVDKMAHSPPAGESEDATKKEKPRQLQTTLEVGEPRQIAVNASSNSPPAIPDVKAILATSPPSLSRVHSAGLISHLHHHQLAQRPPLAGARRLTVHNPSNARPTSLLTKQLSFKSSSAIPTLNTLAATPTASSSKPSESPSQVRRASSGSGFAQLKPTKMAARDISATDLLKQAIHHR
jgi:hypothetical protein